MHKQAPCADRVHDGCAKKQRACSSGSNYKGCAAAPAFLASSSKTRCPQRHQIETRRLCWWYAGACGYRCFFRPTHIRASILNVRRPQDPSGHGPNLFGYEPRLSFVYASRFFGFREGQTRAYAELHVVFLGCYVDVQSTQNNGPGTLSCRITATVFIAYF